MVVLVVTEVVLTVLWVVVTVVAELAVVVEMLLMLLVEVKLVTVLWVCVMLLLVLEVAVTVSELVALTVTEVVVAVLVVAVAVCVEEVKVQVLLVASWTAAVGLRSTMTQRLRATLRHGRWWLDPGSCDRDRPQCQKTPRKWKVLLPGHSASGRIHLDGLQAQDFQHHRKAVSIQGSL